MPYMSPSSTQTNGDLVKVLYGIQDDPTDGSLPATVLIVEDNAMARVYAVLVVEDAGYSALIADDADGALDALATHPRICALFTDVDTRGRRERHLCSESMPARGLASIQDLMCMHDRLDV